jgi:Sigma-70 region 2
VEPAAFEAQRKRLLGLAYRMLGSLADAEDVVQDAWLRWVAADRAEVASPQAFLVRLTTRLCLDRLKSASERRAVRQERPAPASTSEHRRLPASFVAAVESGDPAGLENLLCADAVAISDGGAQVLAARLPILGADKITRFIFGILRKNAEAGIAVRAQEGAINGRPGLLVYLAGKLDQTVSFDLREGRISRLYMVRNPDKLGAVGAAAG